MYWTSTVVCPVKKLGATIGHQAMVLSQPTSNKDTARGGVVDEPASVDCIQASGVELLGYSFLPLQYQRLTLVPKLRNHQLLAIIR